MDAVLDPSGSQFMQRAAARDRAARAARGHPRRADRPPQARLLHPRGRHRRLPGAGGRRSGRDPPRAGGPRRRIRVRRRARAGSARRARIASDAATALLLVAALGDRDHPRQRRLRVRKRGRSAALRQPAGDRRRRAASRRRSPSGSRRSQRWPGVGPGSRAASTRRRPAPLGLRPQVGRLGAARAPSRSRWSPRSTRSAPCSSGQFWSSRRRRRGCSPTACARSRLRRGGARPRRGPRRPAGSPTSSTSRRERRSRLSAARSSRPAVCCVSPHGAPGRGRPDHERRGRWSPSVASRRATRRGRPAIPGSTSRSAPGGAGRRARTERRRQDDAVSGPPGRAPIPPRRGRASAARVAYVPQTERPDSTSRSARSRSRSWAPTRRIPWYRPVGAAQRRGGGAGAGAGRPRRRGADRLRRPLRRASASGC